MSRWQILACVLTLAVAAFLASSGVTLMRWVDRNLLSELLKDSLGRLVYDEDWQRAGSLSAHLDYSWLEAASRPVLVAHALGDANGPGENTLAALRRSVQRGIKLLEIDVWLDERSILRCHHGPAAPEPFKLGECTLPAALHVAFENEAWLILDIKTDFRATGEQIVRQLSADPAVVRLVFQLYRPDNVDAFASWSSQLPLPGPIVTAYLARRSVQHLASHAARIGAHALTIPLERAPALRTSPPGLALLVHPVHDCAAVGRARQLPLAGMYVTSDVASRARQGCFQ
jgi:hypothetical protein